MKQLIIISTLCGIRYEIHIKQTGSLRIISANSLKEVLKLVTDMEKMPIVKPLSLQKALVEIGYEFLLAS